MSEVVGGDFYCPTCDIYDPRVHEHEPCRLGELGLYRHHRGGLYTLLFVADESTNARIGQTAAVYVSLTNGKIRVRDAGEFFEVVEWPDGVTRPRFVREEQR